MVILLSFQFTINSRSIPLKFIPHTFVSASKTFSTPTIVRLLEAFRRQSDYGYLRPLLLVCYLLFLRIWPKLHKFEAKNLYQQTFTSSIYLIMLLKIGRLINRNSAIKNMMEELHFLSSMNDKRLVHQKVAASPYIKYSNNNTNKEFRKCSYD